MEIEQGMCTAVIMAGGRSARMRATAGAAHKALIPVLGVSLLERNLVSLLSHGFREIFVAVSSREHEVIHYIQERGKVVSGVKNVRLRLYEEEKPLGTIGVAGILECGSEPLLVVNVDNLTTLDLRALVSHHRKTSASLTIATHVESFRVPFGEVVVKGGQVTEYREKPAFDILLSSGTYVLSPSARRIIPKECRTDIPELFSMLKHRKEKIAPFAHQSPWIDVNDAASLLRAEELIKANVHSFELLK